MTETTCWRLEPEAISQFRFAGKPSGCVLRKSACKNLLAMFMLTKNKYSWWPTITARFVVLPLSNQLQLYMRDVWDVLPEA